MFFWVSDSEPTLWQNLQCNLFRICPKSSHYTFSGFSTLYSGSQTSDSIIMIAAITVSILLFLTWPLLKSVCGKFGKIPHVAESEFSTTDTSKEDSTISSNEMGLPEFSTASPGPIRYGVRVYPPEVYQGDNGDSGDNAQVVFVLDGEDGPDDDKQDIIVS